MILVPWQYLAVVAIVVREILTARWPQKYFDEYCKRNSPFPLRMMMVMVMMLKLMMILMMMKITSLILSLFLCRLMSSLLRI